MKRALKIQSLNNKETRQKKNKFDDALLKLGVSEKKKPSENNNSKKSLKAV